MHLELSTGSRKREEDTPVHVRAMHWKIPNLLAFVANLVSVVWFWKAEGLPKSLGWFSPENYAQGIWLAIYLVDTAFAVWQLLVYPGEGEVPEPAVDALNSMSPSWCAAQVFATLSAVTDSEHLGTPELRWINSALLSAVPASICFAFLAVTEAELVKQGQQDTALTATLNIMALPMNLHLGWGLIEALASWSSYAALCGQARWANMILALFFVALVRFLGTFLTIRRSSPILGFTLAWGIVAVGVGTLRSSELHELGIVVTWLCAAGEFLVAGGLLLVSWREQQHQQVFREASVSSVRAGRTTRITQRSAHHWRVRQSERVRSSHLETR